jgi:KDO2-lipid IV(A) lauroyltransferase
MDRLIYLLTVPWLFALSYMPFGLLYALSDVLCVVLHSVVGYRVTVVRENLLNSFPSMSKHERKTLEKRFYRYFCDVLVESVKNLSISNETLNERVVFENLRLFENYARQGRSIIIVMGHFGNWELAGSRFGMVKYHQPYVIYKSQKNKYFDAMIRSMRTRTGNRLYEMRKVYKEMLGNRDQLTATVFIADQAPSYKDAFTTRFLDQETRVFTGAFTIAQKLDHPVIYASVKRTGRGRYRISLQELEAEPSIKEPNEMASRFMQCLEQDIITTPETWLWTHRRWKHTRPKA